MQVCVCVSVRVLVRVSVRMCFIVLHRSDVAQYRLGSLSFGVHMEVKSLLDLKAHRTNADAYGCWCSQTLQQRFAAQLNALRLVNNISIHMLVVRTLAVGLVRGVNTQHQGCCHPTSGC